MNETQAAVLVVDDEPILRRLLSSVLTDAGYRVEVASDAAQAKSLLSRGSYDLALVDKNLPGVNGIALIREMKLIRSNLSCAVMTGYATVESCLEALDVGAVGYLWKPFEDLNQVVAKIIGYLGEHKRRTSRPPLPSAPASVAVAPIQILLVAPPTSWRLSFEAQLGEAGFTVNVTDGFGPALQALKPGVTDVVIVDEKVDPSGGIALLTRMRQQDIDVAFLLVATSPSLPLLTRLIELGGAGCLSKPLSDAESIVDKVRAVAQRSRRLRGIDLRAG